MEWQDHQDRSGLVFEHPVGWIVQELPGPAIVVRGPDQRAMVLIQPLRSVGAQSGSDIIQKGLFPAAGLFPNAKPSQIQAGPGGAATGLLNYLAPDGTPAIARLSYIPSGGDMGMLYAAGAPVNLSAELEPTLTRILQSLRQAQSAPTGRQAVQSPQASVAAPITYTRFTDPQMGAFAVDVPRGWQVRGGFAHPMAGDRRPWVETMSPDGIYIALCDQNFPQSFCHFPGQGEGQLVSLAAGGQFLNLKPSSERLAECYLKNIAPRRYGAFQPSPFRPRPDLVQLVANSIRKMGMTIPGSAQITASETMLQLSQNGQPRIASLSTTAFFNGEYVMGMWAFWDGNVQTYIAPPELVARAEEIRMHMTASYQNTPRMMQIYQNDEAIIAANDQAANMAQWNWFAGQQAVHNAQNAFGDTIVNNYWQQQRANDSMMRGWEQNQAVNDRLSQDRSDAMMDRQRLADDAAGKEYDVPAGFNYYWRDQQTGQIIGTNTADPPDYSNSYTQLRKQ